MGNCSPPSQCSYVLDRYDDGIGVCVTLGCFAGTPEGDLCVIFDFTVDLAWRGLEASNNNGRVKGGDNVQETGQGGNGRPG